MKRQHFLFVWRFWGNNLTWFVPIDQTRKAFNLKDKTRRERKTVCRTLINISSWFLGINYTSSWISQPLSMWDGAVLVPLKYSLLSLRFLPLMLHILLLLLPFSLCSLYSFFRSMAKTAHTNKDTQHSRKLLQNHVLVLRQCPPKCTHPHRDTKNKHAQSKGHRCTMKQSMNRRTKTDLAAVYGSLCSSQSIGHCSYHRNTHSKSYQPRPNPQRGFIKN